MLEDKWSGVMAHTLVFISQQLCVFHTFVPWCYCRETEGSPWCLSSFTQRLRANNIIITQRCTVAQPTTDVNFLSGGNQRVLQDSTAHLYRVCICVPMTSRLKKMLMPLDCSSSCALTPV